MAHMVDVTDFEQTGTDDHGNHFDVLLSCGHLQEVVTGMPKPPSRVMCRECLDAPAKIDEYVTWLANREVTQ